MTTLATLRRTLVLEISEQNRRNIIGKILETNHDTERFQVDQIAVIKRGKEYVFEEQGKRYCFAHADQVIEAYDAVDPEVGSGGDPGDAPAG